jgi:hypothetical protein
VHWFAAITSSSLKAAFLPCLFYSVLSAAAWYGIEFAGFVVFAEWLQVPWPTVSNVFDKQEASIYVLIRL